ncbi:hypothetical protein [Kitasatospora indigofera]|uniref:hypothetical protein n=1 Tax=Kitasatospora indigofera TaxID=67307 RepID=UPI00367CBC7D
MDRQTYTAELASLRELRAEITAAEKVVAAAQKELDKLTGPRSRKVAGLAGYEGAKADAIAKASGLPIGEVVRIAPLLDPTPAAVREARTETPAAPVAQPAPHTETGPAAVAPVMTRRPDRDPVESATVAEPVEQAVAAAPAPTPAPAPAAAPVPVAAPAPVVVAAPDVPQPAAVPAEQRLLPQIPQGPAGDAFAALTSGLLSTRPRFEQQVGDGLPGRRDR